MRKLKLFLTILFGVFFLASCSLNSTEYPKTPGNDVIEEGEESYTLTIKYYDSNETIKAFTKKLNNTVYATDFEVSEKVGHSYVLVDEEGNEVELEDIHSTQTIYVKYVANEYILRFFENGFKASEEVVAYNSEIEAIEATHIPTGKRFVGWSSSSVEYVEYDFTTMPANHVDLHAFYEDIEYSVTVVTNIPALDGFNHVKSYLYGDRVSQFLDEELEEAINNLENYKLLGWYLDSELTEKFNYLTMPASNLTVYAKWSYEGLSFNDGENLIAPGSGSVGQPIEFPSAPEKEGYTFAGWYLDADFTQKIEPGTILTDDIQKIYAKYTPNSGITYIVNYYLQSLGVTFPLYESVELTGTTKEEVEAQIKSFAGFTFDEENAKNVLSGEVLGDGSQWLLRNI